MVYLCSKLVYIAAWSDCTTAGKQGKTIENCFSIPPSCFSTPPNCFPVPPNRFSILLFCVGTAVVCCGGLAVYITPYYTNYFI